MKSILLFDGVTGAGKSSVLAELRQRSGARLARVIYEDETLGAIIEQVRDPSWLASPTFQALETVLEALEDFQASNEEGLFLVERFHLTIYALFPQWHHVVPYDERLKAIGASNVLLSYPDRMAEARSIERADRESEGWAAGMDECYGSRAGAVEAVVVSQQRRREALGLSDLPFLHLDTRAQTWDVYARTIMAFVGLT